MNQENDGNTSTRKHKHAAPMHPSSRSVACAVDNLDKHETEDNRERANNHSASVGGWISCG